MPPGQPYPGRRGFVFTEETTAVAPPSKLCCFKHPCAFLGTSSPQTISTMACGAAQPRNRPRALCPTNTAAIAAAAGTGWSSLTQKAKPRPLGNRCCCEATEPRAAPPENKAAIVSCVCRARSGVGGTGTRWELYMLRQPRFRWEAGNAALLPQRDLLPASWRLKHGNREVGCEQHTAALLRMTGETAGENRACPRPGLVQTATRALWEKLTVWHQQNPDPEFKERPQ